MVSTVREALVKLTDVRKQLESLKERWEAVATEDVDQQSLDSRTRQTLATAKSYRDQGFPAMADSLEEQIKRDIEEVQFARQERMSIAAGVPQLARGLHELDLWIQVNVEGWDLIHARSDTDALSNLEELLLACDDIERRARGQLG